MAVFQEKEVVVPVKFWNTTVPADRLVFFHGIILKDSADNFYINVNSFKVLDTIPDAPHVLTVTLTCHGTATMHQGNLVVQSSPYDPIRKESYGSWNTQLVMPEKPPRQLPPSGTQLTLAGTVTGMDDGEFIVLMGFMEYFRSAAPASGLATPAKKRSYATLDTPGTSPKATGKGKK